MCSLGAEPGAYTTRCGRGSSHPPLPQGDMVDDRSPRPFPSGPLRVAGRGWSGNVSLLAAVLPCGVSEKGRFAVGGAHQGWPLTGFFLEPFRNAFTLLN